MSYSKATSSKGQRQGRRLPSYNPTRVLIETVKAQGYDPGDTALSIEDSRVSFPGVFPLEYDSDRDHKLGPVGLEFGGVPHVPKFSPRTTSGKGE